MSIITNVDEISYELRQNIHKDLEIKMENKYNMGPPKYVYPFEIVNDDIILPFAYATRRLRLPRKRREHFSSMRATFNSTLREEQKELLKEALQLLSGKGSVIISAACGFGKTVTSIRLATQIGLKTLVIVNKIVLIKQWRESIERFCDNVNTQCLTAKSTKKEADFYIMNAQNVEKMPKGFFADVGCVIVDEAHLIMAETLSRSLQHVSPRYLIGLTATPYRPDGLDKLLEFYFGKYKIVRRLWREHIVYKVVTGFKPTIETTRAGKVNWGMVLDSQANDFNRNELIIRLLRHFSTYNFLVLTKRISQGEYLIKRLEELGESVTSLIGTKQEFEVSSRILVGTTQKVGVGFDHPRLNALLLAADLEEYFIQYLGRVFRTKEGTPLILDLVDNYSLLEKHFRTRQKVYQDHGGTVKTFNLRELS
jgi:superfamily II DNA or RNA helicase